MCRVELRQDVPGKPEFAAYRKGLRFLFPSDEQRQMFLANPSKYTQPRSSPAGAQRANAGSGVR